MQVIEDDRVQVSHPKDVLRDVDVTRIPITIMESRVASLVQPMDAALQAIIILKPSGTLQNQVSFSG